MGGHPAGPDGEVSGGGAAREGQERARARGAHAQVRLGHLPIAEHPFCCRVKASLWKAYNISRMLCCLSGRSARTCSWLLCACVPLAKKDEWCLQYVQAEQERGARDARLWRANADDQRAP